jgi:signal transduction histidine kinase/CheY-like chemotaxis protein
VRRRVDRLWPEDSSESKAARVAEYVERPRQSAAPFMFKAPDGRWSLIRERPTVDGGFVRVETDITAVKEAEELAAVRQGQLQQAQKMEAVGQLTGGLAHDFNNLLGVIIGNLDLLKEKVEGRPEENALVGAALDFALRGAELNRRLLAFSRRQSLQPECVNVNDVLAGMTQLLSRAVGERVAIRLNSAAEIWPVSVDLAQFEAAIVNLTVNARDALPDGGTVLIDTACTTVENADAHPGLSPGAYVCVSVTDNGMGMTPEVQARAFEPFFTTKPIGAGSGLGLSMVFGFIKQSHGYVTIYSEPGRGTVVRLYLPRAAVGAEVAQPRDVPEIEAGETEAAPRGTETVLMVEDNEAVARVAMRQLKDLGYRVLDTRDAVQALTLIAGDTPVDLLFTDVVMPGTLDGVALAHKAMELRPGLKVLLTSGFPQRPNITAGRDEPLPAPLLVKPYRKQHLAVTIRQVLDQPVAEPVS